MKIDRRSFLALGIGAAAGTALTPVPWKLTDDSSIWTQNWPWTPVPEDGEVTYENSVCTLCPGGCGITVRKINDRIVKIEGMKSHPVNDGGICLLGISGTQFLYGPSRVKSPLKRTGKRGQGGWKEISWEEAIADVVVKLKELEEKKNKKSLMCISSSDRGTVPQLFERLLTAYGSPNFIKTPSMDDSFDTVLKKMHGQTDHVEMGFDLEHTEFVLSFGSGLIDGWGSPVRMIRASSIWKDRNVKVIQVEQRISSTAASSNGLFAVHPGTEADFALGLACVIIDEGLYSEKFTGAFSTGFPEFRNMVRKYYTPDVVSKKTGIQRHMIIELARHFASPSSKSVAVSGRGKGNTTGSIREFMAVHSLNALVGNINAAGGVWAVERPNYINWAKDVFVLEAIDGKERLDEAGSSRYPDVKYLLGKIPEKINSSKEVPVQALFVSNANPFYTMHDTRKVAEAFDKIPFIVSFSSYMDETAAHADLILPNHNYLERYEDVPVSAGLAKSVIGLARPVVAPQYDTMHSGDVVIKIAKALGGKVARAFKWNDYQSCLEKTLGNKWAELKEKGYWVDLDYQPPAWGLAFGGTFRKFSFSGMRMKTPGLAGDEKTYPLTLVPKESMRLASSHLGDPPFAVKSISDTELLGKEVLVEINPQTARKYGLSHGKDALLTTPVGSAKVKVCFYDGAMPDVIAIPKGLGHTAYDSYLKGKGVNYNELVSPMEDPSSGYDVCWGIRAKIVSS